MRALVKEIKTHYLFPSTLFYTKEEHLVTTILGSCISVCLYDSTLKIGGINHYMMPLWNGSGLATPKYGNIAIEKLIDQMTALGSRRNKMIAKVFGGADQLGNKSFKIGERNTNMAREIISEHGIIIAASSVGGRSGRKIIFNTYTGEVRLKYVRKSNNHTT